MAGISHHTCPVELRERLVFTSNDLPAALRQARENLDNAAVVILSTCNRVEIYAHHPSPPSVLHDGLQRFLTTWHKIAQDVIGDAMYLFEDRDVVRHLFRVSSGLDSLVIGEGQILGQVHDAYEAAHVHHTTDKVISALFQRAFAVAKRVRTQTQIGIGKVSVSSVAVDLAVSIFMNLADKTVLIVGSGEMGGLTLKHLLARGIGAVLVANRSIERAAALAGEFGGEAIALDNLNEHLHRADIVISSTGAPGYVLHRQDFEVALRHRGRRPIFVIDIAVPRDVEPAANELDNIYLYDMDDLEQVVDANLEARRDETQQCVEIIERSVDQFWNWLRSLAAEPTIVSMTREVDAIREQELQKTLSALPDLSPEERAEVTYLTKRIVNAILQRPMSQLKREVVEEDPHRVLHLVKRLFGLDEGA